MIRSDISGPAAGQVSICYLELSRFNTYLMFIGFAVRQFPSRLAGALMTFSLNFDYKVVPHSVAQPTIYVI
jgi:hypothetical protein